MSTEKIQFTDGEVYENYMGVWSQLVGEAFLDWMKPKSEMRWLDIGCGNGAFTETLMARCDPKTMDGLDPSEEQLVYARKRTALNQAHFQKGDAMALPYPDNSFDVAVMPLVIFFVPDPAKGVAEMARVVSPGGIVSAYGWDLIEGGFPYFIVQEEIKAMGITLPLPPNPGASQIPIMKEYWIDAGLKNIVTKEITVERTFANFEVYWSTILKAPSFGSKLAVMPSEDIAKLKQRLQAKLGADADGRILCKGTANAIYGSAG